MQLPKLAVVFVLASLAQATTVFNYSDFSSSDFSTTGYTSPNGPLNLVGNAALSGTQVQLTNSTGYQSGSLYTSSPVTIGANDAFSTSFQFQFTNPSGSDPGEGITFILFMPTCSDPSCAPQQGFSSGDLGYYQNNVQHSVGVEFDTYDEEPVDQSSSNHVATLTGPSIDDSNLTNVYGISTCNSATYNQPGCMSNGDIWTANISYDGTDLTVTLYDPAKGFTTTVLNAVPFDIPGTLCSGWPSSPPCPNTTVYAGLTGSTGGGPIETQSILNWTLSDSPSTNSSVPEPSSAFLSGSGLVLLAFGYCTVIARRIARSKLCRPVSRTVMDSSI